MGTIQETPNPSSGTISGARCVICYEEITGVGAKFLFGDAKNGRIDENLESQLSVFFLLRKILCLSNEFLESLLAQCGSPTSWKIQLCRHCTRLYKEVEYLWGKIQSTQREFEKVSSEMNDMIMKSITPDEERAKKIKNPNYRKAAVEKKLKSNHVVEGVRTAFFLYSRGQPGRKTPGNKPIADCINSEVKNSGFLTWSDCGIPYLSLANFEKKMKELIDAAGTQDTSKNCESKKVSPCAASTQTIPDNLVEKSIVGIVAATESNDIEEEMEIDLDEHRSKLNSNITTSKSSSITINIPTRNLKSSAPSEKEQEECGIRIVQTSSLMEPDAEDNDSVPFVIGVLKHDPDRSIEVDSGDSLGDPLAPDDNDNDPDYFPDQASKVPISKKGDKPSPITLAIITNGVTPTTEPPKNLEEVPSKFKSLLIQACKKGPKVFECSKCVEGFETRLGCQAHILRDHYEDRQPFHCHICSVKFTLSHPLKEHVFKAHGGIRTPYDDDFDPVTDYISLEYSKNLSSNVPEEKPKDRRSSSTGHDCPACSQSYTVRRNMVKHAKTVHGLDLAMPPPIQRRPSHDAFASPRGLTSDTSPIYSSNINQKNVPLRVPSGKTTMKCPDCEKILPTPAAMAEHLKNPENKCPDCTKHFQFNMDLKRHIEMQHAKRNALQCPYCPKSFSAQIIYDKHIENHQIHDVHECEVCHEKFTGFANLNRHLETHAALLQQQAQCNPELFGGTYQQ